MQDMVLLENQVIKLTENVIHSYFNGDKEAILHTLDKKAVWIGPNDFQWAESAEQFGKLSEFESFASRYILNREHYRVTAHSGNLWVVYGTFYLTAMLEDKNISTTKQRVTLIWSLKNGEWSIVHMHISTADDYSESAAIECSSENSTAFFEYISENSHLSQAPPKMVFKATDKRLYSISPTDVVYVKSERQYCHIFLNNKTDFSTRISLYDMCNILKNDFIKSHRSYIINPAYIVECKYMKILLSDGSLLPCSKDKFADVKKAAANYKLNLIK